MRRCTGQGPVGPASGSADGESWLVALVLVTRWGCVLIRRDQEIAGIPAVTARDLLKTMRNYAVTAGHIADHLGVTEREGKVMVERLSAEGLLCRVDPGSRAGVGVGPAEVERSSADLELWGTTVSGDALSKARIGTPMPRKEAQALLDGLISRALEVSEDPDSAFTIERINVFGSFADKARPEVGDVDAYVTYSVRVDRDRFIELAEDAAQQAERSGRRFATPVDGAWVCRGFG